MYEGNRCSVLQNGALFPAMIADIQAARHTVHLETFVWTAGEVERQFVEALCCKVSQGVKVRLLIDALGGSGATREQLKKLRDAGVELADCARPGGTALFNHVLTAASHRRRAVGYTSPRHRDQCSATARTGTLALHAVLLEGGGQRVAIGVMRTGSKIRLPAAATLLSPPEPMDFGVALTSSARTKSRFQGRLLYTVAIASARKEVIVQNPYFAPDDGVCELFAKMVKRGVAVHLMVPGKKTDSPFVRVAGSHLYQSLLEAGVRVYEFQPTLLHQKVVIVDRIWSHVGSTNFASRSLALNEEIGVGILDERTAEELREAFEADLRRSTELQLERWRRRPLLVRGYSWLAYQLHSQL